MRGIKMEKFDEKKCGESKICAVCGDQALGYNFNAVTCESCKAFFRRNALRNKELQCPFKENCHITSVTRRFCQRCRLAKCYSAGMKRELIMSEADKESKRRKVLANKAKFSPTTACTSPNGSSSSQESNFSEFPKLSLEVAVQTDLPCSCSCSSFGQNNQALMDFNNCYSASTAGSPELSVPSSSPRPHDFICSTSLPHSPGSTGMPPSLDRTQSKLLEDLVLASKALDAPVDHEVSFSGEEFKNAPKSLIDVINLTALAIRRLIKMCKKISGFKLLCQEDQVSLLKQGCTQMLLLKSVTQFDPDKNIWKIPHKAEELAQIQLEVLKEARGNIYEAHENFVRTFDWRAAKDPKVMCILTAIALFDPSKQQLIDRPTVIRHQEMYYNLLKRYLDSVHHDSSDLYQHLVIKMVELRHINEDHVKVYLEVNPSQMEPILIEIFDVKPH
ncbi:receptor [Nesidiocoris tenuis]|uniref:Receptor n=1 Tax=Nesidiocoris tenuis TaxID=355587 RepID=A0ABN7AWB3_9HEMI|nr:receptor [Nesidiocoris tenuis]